MRLLFELDAKDYSPGGTAFVRPSARAVIIHDNRVAMVHSIQYDYYKFPGGGIESGESPIDALIRETAEEAGLSVLPQSIREYGYVHRIEKGHRSGLFIQDNYYYLCEAGPQVRAQSLSDSEAEARFILEWIDPRTAIDVNRTHDHGPTDQTMLEREARVLERLMEEDYLTA